MGEWEKTLISTTAGFVAGLLAEPAKMWIGNRRKQTELRRALYVELNASLGRMAAFLQYAENQSGTSDLDWAIKTFDLSPIRLDILDYYWEKERSLVMSLDEARWIAHIYRLFARLNERIDDPVGRVPEIRKAVEHIYLVARDGALPSRSLQVLAQKWLDHRHS